MRRRSLRNARPHFFCELLLFNLVQSSGAREGNQVVHHASFDRQCVVHPAPFDLAALHRSDDRYRPVRTIFARGLIEARLSQPAVNRRQNVRQLVAHGEIEALHHLLVESVIGEIRARAGAKRAARAIDEQRVHQVRILETLDVREVLFRQNAPQLRL